MLFKLAFSNIKKSLKDYSIYFFTLVIGVAIFYIFNSLDTQESMLIMSESKYDIVKTIIQLLSYVSVFISVILGFLIVYSNNFLIKRRKKEFGLYLTLGMSKRKVSMILVVETLLVGVISLIVGLLLGVFLSQFLSIFTAKLFEVNMSTFKFVFSNSALMKTILYFGIIFIFVMIFNIVTLSKNKLINLLTAKSKNEKVKMRNKYVLFVSFALAIGLLYYAYKQLFSGALFELDNNALYMIIAGAFGTYFLFFSIAGVFLKVVEKCKKFYYKNLNVFLVRQINSRANTSVLSTTIISLMLLLTIGILSGSISLVSVFNNDINNNNLTDASMISYAFDGIVDEEGNISSRRNETDLSGLINDESFDDYVSEYAIYNIFNSSDMEIVDLFNEKTFNKLKKEFGETVNMEFPVDIMKESEYNKILELYGIDDFIDIKEDEYLLTVNIPSVMEYYVETYKSGKTLNINDNILKPYGDEVIEIGFKNFSGASNAGTIIVDDSIIKDMEIAFSVLLVNYVDTDNVEKLEQGFLDMCMNFAYNVDDKMDMRSISYYTALQMKETSIGMKAMLTFVGLYLGIIFAIASATVLAIGQLSESSDNKERYKVLRQIGADEKIIRKTLFAQIAVAFLLPLVVALFHSYFGLRELNGIIEMFGNIDLTENIFLTTVFIVIVYGGYFIATYLCSKSIIKE